MKPSPWIAILAAGFIFNMACDSDIRESKPDRTRDADGIIKLYRNHEQGDWMLKGKVILVEAAVIVSVSRGGSALTVTGRNTLTPIPISLRFHESEKKLNRLSPGDLITFKGRCTGMRESIQFESCVLISVFKQVPTS